MMQVPTLSPPGPALVFSLADITFHQLIHKLNDKLMHTYPHNPPDNHVVLRKNTVYRICIEGQT